MTQDMEDFRILKQKPIEKFPQKNTRADNAQYTGKVLRIKEIETYNTLYLYLASYL